MKDMKYTAAYSLPQVSPAIQSGAVLLQSYMILFQSSPVEIEKSKRKLRSKTVKFLYSLMARPDLTPLNMNCPRVAKMKKNSIRSMKTLIRAETEYRIVLNKDWRPL